MLLGVHPPSSPVKHWWGSRFSRRRPDPYTGSTDLHGLSVAGLGPDLTIARVYTQYWARAGRILGTRQQYSWSAVAQIQNGGRLLQVAFLGF